MKTKFKLGPLQKAWVKELREHPERQIMGELGSGNIDKFKACCLGQLHVCAKGKNAFNERGEIDDGDLGYLHSCTDYGLRSSGGSLKDFHSFSNGTYTCLSNANDGGVPWSELADFIEQNPEKVFTKSV